MVTRNGRARSSHTGGRSCRRAIVGVQSLFVPGDEISACEALLTESAFKRLLVSVYISISTVANIIWYCGLSSRLRECLCQCSLRLKDLGQYSHWCFLIPSGPSRASVMAFPTSVEDQPHHVTGMSGGLTKDFDVARASR